MRPSSTEWHRRTPRADVDESESIQHYGIAIAQGATGLRAVRERRARADARRRTPRTTSTTSGWPTTRQCHPSPRSRPRSTRTDEMRHDAPPLRHGRAHPRGEWVRVLVERRADQFVLHALASQVKATTGPTTTTSPVPACDPLASLRPSGTLPAPMQMPTGLVHEQDPVARDSSSSESTRTRSSSATETRIPA